MKLSKTLFNRLDSAFKGAQKKTMTSYHFTFMPYGTAEFKEATGYDEVAVMCITRSARGAEDESHFIIHVNVPAANERTMAQLRMDAGHEVLHALLFDLYEKNNLKNLENAVYKLQRAFFGEEK
jgi:hypothetical protein